MFKRLILVLLLIPVFVFAQSPGKIAGVVTDKSTGEPLPGVNVILEGTTLGSSTDIDGYYVVLNVPVGVYNLRANYIGYKDVVVQDVRVSASITTEVNFQLTPTTLELEEAIVITAERPLVEKNVTSSISLVTNKELESIPVRGFNDLMALQNSVVVQDGNIHIRGGREEETGYYLDGASTMNPLNNTNAIYVIQEAIEEFQVLAGGYTAEFGGANSGIIRTELKTGGADYHFTIDGQTDKFVGQGEKFLNTYSYQHHILVGTVSGPLFNNKIRFFLAGENNYQGDDEVRFSRGYTFSGLDDINSSRPFDTTLTMFYPEGFTPHSTTNRYAFNGSLLFDYNPIKFRLSGTYNMRRNWSDGAFQTDVPWLDILNNRQVYDDLTSMLLTGKITHILSPRTYYELNVSYFNYELERNDDYFGNDWASWFDSTKVASYTNGDVAYRDRWRPQYNYILAGFPVERNGNPNDFYRHLKQNYISGALNFVSQIGRHHEVKFGLDARQYTVRYFDLNPSVMYLTADTAYSNARQDYPTTYGSIKGVPPYIWVSNGGVDAYGFDIYGNETSGETNYGEGVYTGGPRKPLFFATYLQDKIEFNDIVINAGLRLDYFDTDDQQLKNPTNPQIDEKSGLVLRSEWKNVDPFVQLSPRLGFSFPVSEKTVFYMQYGKFIQMPSLDQVYFSSWRMSRQIRGGFYYINPIGFGLEPIRTTSYEMGFRQQLSNVAAIDITGFYKNVKGQVQVEQQSVVAGADVQNYERFINGDFATTKGLEFRLTLRRTNRLQAQINYTLTQAEGTGSNNTAYHAAVYNGTEKPTVIFPLDYSQKHTGSINLDYRFGKNDGGPVFERFGANVLFTFSSGHPYTYVYAAPGGQVDPYVAGVDYMFDTRTRRALEPLGSSTTPWTFNVDLHLDKTFSLMANLDATIYARVTNLFNTKNVLNVFEMTGTATDDGYLTDPARSGANIERLGAVYRDMYQAINLDNGGSYFDVLGRELYGNPRQIMVGLKLAY